MTAFRLTVIHPVPDFERWRSILNEDLTAGHPGLVRRSVFRSLDDPNEVMVELEFDSEEAAKAFLPSLDLRDLLDRSGVEVYPPVFIGQEVADLAVEAPPDR
jgi:Antibiotic biosynthesis monooxygenase